MDLGAGTNSGAAPVSVVANPSGYDTGVWRGTPAYAMVSGNNTWGFTDNDTVRMEGIDVFDMDAEWQGANPTWVKSWVIVMRVGAVIANQDRNFWGYMADGPSHRFGLRLTDFSGTEYAAVVGGQSERQITIDDKPNTCQAHFVVMSGSNAGANCVISGSHYLGVNTEAMNYPLGSANQFASPNVNSGVLGFAGTNWESPNMNVLCWAGWDGELTTADRQQIVDYFSIERGFDVL